MKRIFRLTAIVALLLISVAVQAQRRNSRYNEYIMTSLRTMWGVSLTYTEEAFGTELRQYCTKMAAPYLQSHKLEMQADRLRLTREGIFVSDGIISDLMFID